MAEKVYKYRKINRDGICPNCCWDWSLENMRPEECNCIEVICSGDGCGKRCKEGFRSGELIYHPWARNDAYGMYTGLYCDVCYKDNYPYRRDGYYDPMDAGERLEPDDNLPWEN